MSITLKAALPKGYDLNGLDGLDPQDLADDPRPLLVVAQLKPVSVEDLLDDHDLIVKLAVVAVEPVPGPDAEAVLELLVRARAFRTGRQPLHNPPLVGDFYLDCDAPGCDGGRVTRTIEDEGIFWRDCDRCEGRGRTVLPASVAAEVVAGLFGHGWWDEPRWARCRYGCGIEGHTARPFFVCSTAGHPAQEIDPQAPERVALIAEREAS